MKLSNTSIISLLKLLVMSALILQTAQACNTGNKGLTKEHSFPSQICSLCHTGPLSTMTPHEIPEEFPIFRIEYTIFPIKTDKESALGASLKIKTPAKHLACCIMKIRFKMMKQRQRTEKRKRMNYWASQTIEEYQDAKTIKNKEKIDEWQTQIEAEHAIKKEIRWLTDVFLMLWEGSEYDFVEYNDDSQPRYIQINHFINYLAVTLPDLFPVLSASFRSAVENSKINIQENLNQKLVDKLARAESESKVYEISENMKLESLDLFSLPDSYFLYPILEIKKFLTFYSLENIMEFICSDLFAKHNAHYEPFNVCKTVFIALVASKAKKERKFFCDKFTEFGKNIQRRILNKDMSAYSADMLKKAKSFKANSNKLYMKDTLRDMVFDFDAFIPTVDRIIKILENYHEEITADDETWINEFEFVQSKFLRTINHRSIFRNILQDDELTQTYDSILKHVVDFGMDPISPK